jgi:YegS/Rv2252/BmrU family lipid kinase
MSNIPSQKIKKIHIIINPASGRIEPILPIINSVLAKTDIDWDVFVTKKPHDACEFAKEAIKNKVDALAVYGGDGTVMETIRGMIDSEVPLAILPGGTANVLATELRIPKDLKEACQLMCESTHARDIDVAQFDKYHFVLRMGLGFEAEMMKGADREIKNRFGRLAYVLSSIKALQKIKETRYSLKIDGKEYESQGITCIVANSGNIGISDLSLDNDIKVDDGLLDVIIVRKVNISLFAHIVAIFLSHKSPNNVELVQHWQGKEIQVSSTPKQIAQIDGELLGKIPIHAKIIPSAVRIIVPKPDLKKN